jgi:hypothetical protein
MISGLVKFKPNASKNINANTNFKNTRISFHKVKYVRRLFEVLVIFCDGGGDFCGVRSCDGFCCNGCSDC